VLLKSLGDEEAIVMNKVSISSDYWNALNDLDTFEVYKNTGNLALTKSGKSRAPNQAMKFNTMKAKDVRAILSTIYCFNCESKIPSRASKVADPEDRIDDSLFNGIN
jgi:hypothetical protein